MSFEITPIYPERTSMEAAPTMSLDASSAVNFNERMGGAAPVSLAAGTASPVLSDRVPLDESHRHLLLGGVPSVHAPATAASAGPGMAGTAAEFKARVPVTTQQQPAVDAQQPEHAAGVAAVHSTAAGDRVLDLRPPAAGASGHAQKAVYLGGQVTAPVYAGPEQAHGIQYLDFRR